MTNTTRKRRKFLARKRALRLGYFRELFAAEQLAFHGFLSNRVRTQLNIHY
jgi:hypothetical protein